MTQILKNKLFIGDIFDANNSYFLKENNITTIINLSSGKIVISNSNIIIYNYNMNDNFENIIKVIENEKIVLVVCIAGIDNSPILVLSYVLYYYDITLKDAYLDLKNKRSQTKLNKKFIKYLIDFEYKCLGFNSINEIDF